MPETTQTQRSAHLIQGNSSLSRPGAYMARDLPITLEGPEPSRPLYRAIVAVLCAAVAIAVAALLAPGGLIFTK